MILRKLLRFLVVCLVGLALFSCKLPWLATPVPFYTPTPDLTLTALYAMLFTVTALPPSPMPVPSSTALPGVEPSATLPPPTFTASALPSSPLLPSATLPPSATFPPPTNTPHPVSGSGPRPGNSLAAMYLQSEPKIDGDFAEWDLGRFDVDHVVYGADFWRNSDDLSGSVMLAWDDNFLYLAARVKDDRYVQNASGKNLFKGDSLEILFDRDLAADYYLEELNGDDYQLGISPGQGKPGMETEAYLWYPGQQAGETFQVEAVGVETSTGYRVEARIPWRLFAITPDIGMRFGFAFSISDNDNPDRNLQQSMVSTLTNRRLTDPTTWENLVLAGQEP